MHCCRFGEHVFVMREIIQEVTTYVNSEYELENVRVFLPSMFVVVGWLLIVPATHKCILGTDLL